AGVGTVGCSGVSVPGSGSGVKTGFRRFVPRHRFLLQQAREEAHATREPPMGINVTFLEQDKQTPAQVAVQLADFLNAAKSSLHIAIYDFRLGDAVASPVMQALQGRAAAGVDVRIAYDAGKPNADFPESGADPAPPGTADFV